MKIRRHIPERDDKVVKHPATNDAERHKIDQIRDASADKNEWKQRKEGPEHREDRPIELFLERRYVVWLNTSTQPDPYRAEIKWPA